jgi:hypothetical protein
MGTQPKLPKKGQKQSGGQKFYGKDAEGTSSKRQEGGHGTERRPNRGGRR